MCMFICLCVCVCFRTCRHAFLHLQKGHSVHSQPVKKKLHTVSHRQLGFHLQSADCLLHKRIHIFFAPITVHSSDKQWNSRWIPTLSGSDLAGLTLNIFDMSSELRCWATSHSLAVMSIRLQMSMSTRLAFSWILESRSDICCTGKDSCFRWHVQPKPCTHTEMHFLYDSNVQFYL